MCVCVCVRVQKLKFTYFPVHLEFILAPGLQVCWGGCLREEQLGPHQKEKVIEQKPNEIFRPPDLQPGTNISVYIILFTVVATDLEEPSIV